MMQRTLPVQRGPTFISLLVGQTSRSYNETSSESTQRVPQRFQRFSLFLVPKASTEPCTHDRGRPDLRIDRPWSCCQGPPGRSAAGCWGEAEKMRVSFETLALFYGFFLS
jgi:hypothetical protein